jgi:hypothetical protein
MPVTDAPKTVTVPAADLAAIMARLNELEAKGGAEPTHIGPRQFAKAPWAEEIWVEPLIDCTHPDHPDQLRGQEDPSNYGVYRKAATDEQPADIFRLKHRELLHRHLRELSKEEVAEARKRLASAKANIPQQAARGMKVIRNPFH